MYGDSLPLHGSTQFVIIRYFQKGKYCTSLKYDNPETQDIKQRDNVGDRGPVLENKLRGIVFYRKWYRAYTLVNIQTRGRV